MGSKIATATWNREDRDLLVELRTTLHSVQDDIKEIKHGTAGELQQQKLEIDLLAERVKSLEETRITYRATIKAWVIVASLLNALLAIFLSIFFHYQ